MLALYLRLKIVKGGSFGFVKLHLVAKFENKNKRGPLWDLKNFQETNFNAVFEQCHSAEKCKRGTSKQPKGSSLVESKNFKKAHCARKTSSEKLQRGGIVRFRGYVRRRFCFGQGSGVSSMFQRSVVQVDDVEQMNKKMVRSRWTDEKNTHCKSQAFSSNTWSFDPIGKEPWYETSLRCRVSEGLSSRILP